MPFDAEPDAQVTARDRLIRLRDFLAELPPEKFDMTEWHCGTTACIGGWAAHLFMGDRRVASDITYPEIGRLIGLDGFASGYLFSASRHEDDATPTQAVRVLDHLLATGEVDWSRMGEP